MNLKSLGLFRRRGRLVWIVFRSGYFVNADYTDLRRVLGSSTGVLKGLWWIWDFGPPQIVYITGLVLSETLRTMEPLTWRQEWRRSLSLSFSCQNPAANLMDSQVNSGYIIISSSKQYHAMTTRTYTNSPSRCADLFRLSWPKGLTPGLYLGHQGSQLLVVTKFPNFLPDFPWFSLMLGTLGHMKVKNPFLIKFWYSEASARNDQCLTRALALKGVCDKSVWPWQAK